MRVVWARMVELKVVEWTEFADGPEVQDEKKRGVKHDAKVFTLTTGITELP